MPLHQGCVSSVHTCRNRQNCTDTKHDINCVPHSQNLQFLGIRCCLDPWKMLVSTYCACVLNFCLRDTFTVALPAHTQFYRISTVTLYSHVSWQFEGDLPFCVPHQHVLWASVLQVFIYPKSALVICPAGMNAAPCNVWPTCIPAHIDWWKGTLSCKLALHTSQRGTQY